MSLKEQSMKMRYATKQERESVKKYVESISVKTGINFFDILKQLNIQKSQCR